MKLNRIWESQDSLQKLFNCDMPIVKAYIMQKAMADVKNELNAAMNIRNDLIKKHGFKRKGKDGHTIPDANNEDELKECGIDKSDAENRLNSFQDDFKQALDVESDLDFPTLRKQELSDVGAMLSPNDVELLNVDFIAE